jgi:uncharacterized small protein (DUF1192 family)
VGGSLIEPGPRRQCQLGALASSSRVSDIPVSIGHHGHVFGKDEQSMSNDSSLSLGELNDRIAILRDNIRQLVEQAASFSGAQNEELTANRIAQQNEELERLIKERDARTKK